MLKERGYLPHPLALDPFLKSGGSVKCLPLTLNQQCRHTRANFPKLLYTHIICPIPAPFKTEDVQAEKLFASGSLYL